MDFGELVNSGLMRYAGETPLPSELDRLRNLILKGQIQDDQGNSITVTPRGDFEIKPYNSPFSVRGSAGYDPSIELRYQSRKPEFVGRTPAAALDEALLRLEQEY